MNLGDKLKTIRKRVGLSQEELADKAQINRSYVSMIENGHSSPTIEVLQKVASGLGIKLSELLIEDPSEHYSLDLEDEKAIYDGLQELLDSEDDLLLTNLTIEEIELLKSIRFSSNFNPSKRFFIEALKEFRRSQRHRS